MKSINKAPGTRICCRRIGGVVDARLSILVLGTVLLVFMPALPRGPGRVVAAALVLVVPGRAVSRVVLPEVTGTVAWGAAIALGLAVVPLVSLALTVFSVRLDAASEAWALAVVSWVAILASEIFRPNLAMPLRAGHLGGVLLVGLLLGGAAAVLMGVNTIVAHRSSSVVTSLSLAPGADGLGGVVRTVPGTDISVPVVVSATKSLATSFVLEVVVDGRALGSPVSVGDRAPTERSNLSVTAPKDGCLHRVQIQLRDQTRVLRELVLYLQANGSKGCS